jgi:hypothetical protein
MLNMDGKFNDHITVVQVMQPQVVAAAGSAGVLSNSIDMSLYSKVFAVVSTGIFGLGAEPEDPDESFATIFKACATEDGTYTALTGKTSASYTPTSEGKVVTIEVSGDLVALAGKRWVKLLLLSIDVDGTHAAVILGVPKLGVASNFNTADVVASL